MPTKIFMAKLVIYVKWPTVYFLCFKFELNLSINKFKSAINWFFLFIVTVAILEKGWDKQIKFLLVTNQIFDDFTVINFNVDLDLLIIFAT